MKVCVQGLWHLGTVTAACLASLGHDVVGFDTDEENISSLVEGIPRVFEPGLSELLKTGLRSGRLRFSSRHDEALADAAVLWVTYDTPVNDDDVADTGFVIEQVKGILPDVAPGSAVLLSSQLPVGTVAAIERFAASAVPEKRLSFACSPENLRLGKALDTFLRPDRIVVGVRDAPARAMLEPLLGSITHRIEWMSVESAEMTKHAINAFLAVSVAFANELAVLCETTGADAKEVERGLKSEIRIGPKAYLAPGVAFSGGTLARDVAFLTDIAARRKCPTPLLVSVRSSNEWHKTWPQRKLQQVLGELGGARIAVWGLTYKPGTDTLRRSAAIELCRALDAQGADIVVHDPAVKTLPHDVATFAHLSEAPLAAIDHATALVVCTEWPEYRAIPAIEIAAAAPGICVIDPNRFLPHLAEESRIRYFAVGTAVRAQHG